MSNEVINPDQLFRDDDGVPLSAGTISFFINATTTLDAIYSDEALTVAQANPYTLDGSGRITGDVKFTGKKTILIKNSSGETIKTIDNVATSGYTSTATVGQKLNNLDVDDYIELRGLTSSQLSDGDSIRVTDNGIAGTFIVRTGTVTDNGSTLIVFTDDSNGYVERTVAGPIDARWFEATNGTASDSQTELTTAYDYCRDNGLALLVEGQFRIDSGLVWDASSGLNPETTVIFRNARLTKNFNGAGLTCAGGGASHIHYGDLIIDKMLNLGDGDGGNATTGDDGFVQNCRLQRYGNLLIEDQAGDGYVCQADANMNGTNLGLVRIRAISGKGFTGNGTQDDAAIWIGNVWVNNCYEGGIYLPDTFPARGWDMTMRGENCGRNGTSDQIYTGGMSNSRITGYGEDSSGGTGADVHIPAASDGVYFYSWRIDQQTVSSSTSAIFQGNKVYTPGNTPTEANVISDNLSDNAARTLTKNWVGSSSANLAKRIIRGNGELSFEVTGRSGGDVMSLDFLPGSGFTFRVQKNAVDEWKVLDGGVARFLGSLVAGGSTAIDGSAVIEARSTTQGLLLPRMTTTQRDAISTPSNGLMIYNTTTDKINVRAGGAWEAVTST